MLSDHLRLYQEWSLKTYFTVNHCGTMLITSFYSKMQDAHTYVRTPAHVHAHNANGKLGKTCIYKMLNCFLISNIKKRCKDVAWYGFMSCSLWYLEDYLDDPISLDQQNHIGNIFRLLGVIMWYGNFLWTVYFICGEFKHLFMKIKKSSEKIKKLFWGERVIDLISSI